ncbi:unnamed protein product [Adineta ricciae]|uniref:Uncharacterized protein n=1 Tax=Adineta ricciae TaxID=249248 RepID=A0A816DR91_ADIRI|nr:unnamed protein product [Adineta ricciae]CAF1637259.1 unnamed protein product [Adineta ricciae]
MDTDKQSKEMTNPSKLDVADHFHQMSSSTSTYIENQRNWNDDTAYEKKMKRKCRGDRKAQNLRRRQRRKQINGNTEHANEHVIVISEDGNQVENGIDEDQIQEYSMNIQHVLKPENKRKRQESNRDDVQVSRSFSQLSISRGAAKKKKKITTATSNESATGLLNGTNDDIQARKRNDQEENDDTDEVLTTNSLHQFKPKYLRTSNRIFTQMLSNLLDANENIIQCFNTNEKLQFLREMVEVINNYQYFDLQQQLWRHYRNISMKEDQSVLKLSKQDAKELNTCRTYGFPKHVIEKRLKTIEHQLQRTSNELQQYNIKLGENAQQWRPSFNSSLLWHVLHEFIRKGQKRLEQELLYRQTMSGFNVIDRQLIAKFYQLRPNEEQIHLAKTIWQTTADKLKMHEREEILRKRIYLQR